MPPDTAAVIIGSTHWGEKCDRRAKISPMKVTIALIVTCRVTLSVVRSICVIRATATTAPTTPQTAAMRTCSKLNAEPPRAITRKQASQAPANFSAAARARPVANESLNVFGRLKLGCSTDPPSSRCASFSQFRKLAGNAPINFASTTIGFGTLKSYPLYEASRPVLAGFFAAKKLAR